MDSDTDGDDDCPELVTAEAPPAYQLIPAAPSAQLPVTKLPVTILTGFLGSGKTTLLHHILTVQHTMRIAVIMNEVSLEGTTIERQLAISRAGALEDEWVEMPNGCLCCSSKGQVVSVLEAIARKKAVEHVIIETSGLADPGPIVTSLWVDDALQSAIHMDGVIAVVDAKNIERYLSHAAATFPFDDSPGRGEGGFVEATQQIAHADRILLNKVDLVPPDAAARVETVLRRVNATAEIVRTTFARIEDVGSLLRINALRLDQQTLQQVSSALLPPPLCHCCLPDTASNAAPHACAEHHHHTEEVGTQCIEFRGWLRDRDGVDSLLAELLCTRHTDGFNVLRLKALLHIAEGRCAVVIQAVADTWDTHDVAVAGGENSGPPINKVVFIGRNLHRRDLPGLVAAHCPLEAP